MSDKDNLFGRFSKFDTSQGIFTGLPFSNSGAAEGTDEPGWSGSLNWTHSFSANLQNEARLGVNAFRFNQNQTPTTSFGNISEKLQITAPKRKTQALRRVTIPTSPGCN